MSAIPDSRWVDRPERGNALALKLITFVATRLGRPVARLLLYPISAYFLLYSRGARQHSRRYLQRALGREPRWGDLWRHFHTFAATILDRLYFLTDRHDLFDIKIFGEAVVKQFEQRHRGCFLVGAHMGSFEALRAVGEQYAGLKIAVVMYEENARQLDFALKTLNPRRAPEVISLGTLDSMLRIEERLQHDAWVGMLGDRGMFGDKTIACDFLGDRMLLPLGPMRLAAILRRPVLLMVALYRGGNRYEIHFEHLTDMSQLSREQRSRAVEAATRLYAQRLEHYCRLAPYNWFNFFDVWAARDQQ